MTYIFALVVICICLISRKSKVFVFLGMLVALGISVILFLLFGAIAAGAAFGLFWGLSSYYQRRWDALAAAVEPEEIADAQKPLKGDTHGEKNPWLD
ncbi:hypothetical protein ACSFC0_16105 [Serratia marcescens]|uniref:hypothetical protein n=1 Tax=Serratia marcescens TaxID=615 RepID=UPI003EDAF8EF